MLLDLYFEFYHCERFEVTYFVEGMVDIYHNADGLKLVYLARKIVSIQGKV